MKTAEKFPNRVRFNWGYHDAAQCVREGWQTRNYGFAAAWTITAPEDILTRHPDPAYARGWYMGYFEATAGNDTSSSEPAWNAAMKAGSVAA